MNCLCSGFIKTDTPQGVKDETEIDVFDEIFTLSGVASDYAEAYKAGLWHAYRYRMIGSCDLEYWEQCVADRLALIVAKYDALMGAFADADLTDLADNAYIIKTQRTPIDGTDGDATTSESETFPITPVDTSKRYLTGRNTQKYAPNNQENTEYKAYGGLTSSTFRKLMDDYDSPLARFIDEFDRFFINRWL